MTTGYDRLLISLPWASLSAVYALYQVSVRQATISLPLLLAYTLRYKLWEFLGFIGNYAPCGLSPQTDGMPVIPNQKAPKKPKLSGAFCFLTIIYAIFTTL